jgi:hypothetical protein
MLVLSQFNLLFWQMNAVVSVSIYITDQQVLFWHHAILFLVLLSAGIVSLYKKGLLIIKPIFISKFLMT